MIIAVTPDMFYLLDTKCNLKYRCRLSDLYEITLVKVNPRFFVTDFGQGVKLILETARRTELVIYVLSQRDGKDPKPRVNRTNGVKQRQPDGKMKLLKFDEIINTKLATAHMDKVFSPQF